MDTSAADRILSKIQRQIWIVTACDGAERGGLVATFVSRASIAPTTPRILVSLAIDHYTTDLVRRSGALAAHLLSENQSAMVWRFGLNSGREVDKLSGLKFRTATTGAPVLDDAGAWLDCRVETSMETGDRIVFLAAVLDAGISGEIEPLTVESLRRDAPANELATMDEHFVRDGEIDAARIEAFRQRKH